MMALRAPYLLALVCLMALLRNSEEGKHLKSFAGPFWVQIFKLYNCPGVNIRNPVMNNISFRFLNQPRSHLELQRITAHGDLTRNLTDTLSGTVEMEVWANNQWKENSIAKMSFPNYVCSGLRKFLPEFSRIVFKMNVNSNEPCTIPAGTISVENTPINWTSPDFPQFIYGQYRGKVKMYNGKTLVDCHMLEGRANPRPN